MKLASGRRIYFYTCVFPNLHFINALFPIHRDIWFDLATTTLLGNAKEYALSKRVYDENRYIDKMMGVKA